MRLVSNFRAWNISGLQFAGLQFHFAALIANSTTAASIAAIAAIAMATDHEIAGLTRRQSMHSSRTAHKIKRRSNAMMTLRTTATGSDGPRDRK
jgi:hypothetical protein